MLSSTEPVKVDPWPTERGLQWLAARVSLFAWIFIAVTIVVLVYAVVVGFVLVVAHLTLIAHIRGNAVRLGSDQVPQPWRSRAIRNGRYSASSSSPPAAGTAERST
jgi:hypothetical protein